MPEQLSRPLDASFADLCGSLVAAGAELAPPPSELAERSGRKGAHLSASGWRLPAGEVRLVRITSPKADIVNALGFPCDPRRDPLLTIEQLSLGAGRAMSFFDLQDGGLDAERRELSALRAQAVRDAALRGGADAALEPEPWALHFSLGGYLFERASDLAAAERARGAQQAYTAAWLELLGARPSAPAALADFKDHQRKHSPGIAYLAGVFGAEWTQSFLTRFLYA